MPLVCPTCKQKEFETQRLGGGPEAERCLTCNGVWISSERYFSFLSTGPEEERGQVSAAPADSPVLKLCPVCARFMHWYEIGHGVAFGVDRCGTCGGMWLNAGEWEGLRAIGLHLKLHFAASDSWQAEVAQEKRLAADAKDLEKRLGAADFAELRRITDWLARHPHRDEMAAFMRERLRGER